MLAAPNFAGNQLSPDDTAYFCYRYDAAARTDSMWATTSTGITAHIVGLAGVDRDLGEFSPSIID